MKWKILVMIGMFIFLLGSVNAAEWDNTKSYNSGTQEVLIENGFGLPLFGTDIAKVKLLTPTTNYVGAGYGKVAEFEIVLYTDYTEAFKELELYNLKKDSEKFERSFDYKYLTEVEVDVDDFKRVCTPVDDGKNASHKENCVLEKTGTHKETQEQWVNLEKYDFNKGDVINVGIFTNVEVGDKVEWIPNLFGVRINEWASWIHSLNVGLVGYWSMDTNAFIDNSPSSNNGTAYNGTIPINAGKVNNSANFTNASVYVNLTTSGGNTDPLNIEGDEFSINGWILPNDCLNGAIYSREEYNGSWLGGFRLGVSSNLFVTEIVTNDNYHGFVSTEGANCTPNKWQMFTIVYNSSDVLTYKNATLSNTQNLTGNINESNASVNIGRYNAGGSIPLNASLDELGVWNRSLSQSEIDNLWNDGDGIYFGEPGEITQNSPIDYYNTTNHSITFNCTAVDDIGVLNLSLIIGNVVNKTVYNTTANSNLSLQTIENFEIGYYNWSCSATNSIGGISSSLTRFFNISNFVVSNETYNSTSYESSAESFILNLTYDSTRWTSSTGILVYNGTSYTGTNTGSGNSLIYSYSMDLPLVTGSVNKSFYWNVGLTNSSGTFYATSTTHNQSVSDMNLTLCGTVPYINFTFKDESTETAINSFVDSSSWTYWMGGGSVSSSLVFSNTTANPSYAFCFSPASRPVTVDLTFKYSNSSGYPQRTYALDDEVLTNSTTNIVLWLLGSSEGIYSSVAVVTSQGSAISGVEVVIERQISGVWVTVGQAITGDDGIVTFWVNPNYNHRITATKTGYTSTQVTIQPSQALYTLTMGTTGGTGTYNGTFQGISWITTPQAGYVGTGNKVFGINLTASLDNLAGSFCKFELLDLSNHSIVNSTTGGSSGGCNLTLTYTISAGQWVYGKYYVDIGTGFILLASDQRWGDIEGTDVSNWQTVWTLFNEMRDLDEWGSCSEDGTCHRQEFSRIVAFFVVLAILIGIFSFYTQVDTIFPGAVMIVILIIIAFASFSNFFSLDMGSLAAYPFFGKYALLFITFLLTAGTLLNFWARNT
jgi:hypothetical protein